MARERVLETVMLVRAGSPSGPSRKRQSGAAVAAPFLLTLLLPWGHAGAAHAVQGAPSVPGEALYRLGPGDVMASNVWGHEGLSAVVQVWPDGPVAFPLVFEPLAAGLTPTQRSNRPAKAALLGPFPGVSLAFVRSVTDAAVHEDDDLQRLLGVPVVPSTPTISVVLNGVSPEGGYDYYYYSHDGARHRTI